MSSGFDGLRLRHWRVESRPDGAMVLSFDRDGKSVNAISQDVLIELEAMLERIALDPPKALIVRSAKDKGFIAGADIEEFESFDAKGTTADAIRRGQRVFQRISRTARTDGRGDPRLLHGRRHRTRPRLPLPRGLERSIDEDRPCPKSNSASIPAGAAACGFHV